MSGKMRDLENGEVVIVTTGEYSDYSMGASFRVLKKVNLDDEHQKFELSLLGEDRDEWNDHTRFTAWLVSQGCVEEFKTVEFHMGSYGRWEPSLQ